MKIIFIISFFLFSFSGCYINSNNLNVKNIKIYNHSQSGRYLSASYSIFKGDVFSANKILKLGKKNLNLLELEFFSNLVSGNFEIANTISNSPLLKDKNNFLYQIPKFAISFKNKNFYKSLKIAKENKNNFGFNKITELLDYWVNLSKAKINGNLFSYNNFNFQLSLHKLLILENFYDIKELKKIADYNLSLKSLSNNDLLLLAGYYYRLNEIEIFEKIIRNKLSKRFNKEYIIENFSSDQNPFNTLPNFQMILSSFLHNISFGLDANKEISSTYIKILLEMSVYFYPNMDISNYSLAELYSLEKLDKIALKKLKNIQERSFFALPANLKKLSIIKSLNQMKAYKDLLFVQYKKWPNNKFILNNLANFYKLNKNYLAAIKIFKILIAKDNKNNNLLFLYSYCLEKIGKSDQANLILLKIIKSDDQDAYSRNYLAYNLALKKENLDLALTLIKRALIINPNNGFFLDTLGWVQYQRNDYNSALFYLEKALTYNPNSPEIMDHLGDCYLMLGRFNEAKYE